MIWYCYDRKGDLNLFKCVPLYAVSPLRHSVAFTVSLWHTASLCMEMRRSRPQRLSLDVTTSLSCRMWVHSHYLIRYYFRDIVSWQRSPPNISCSYTIMHFRCSANLLCNVNQYTHIWDYIATIYITDVRRKIWKSIKMILINDIPIL